MSRGFRKVWAVTWLLSLPAFVCFALVVLNALTWTRGRRSTRHPKTAVSVLVPARNEERNIEACLRNALESAHMPTEVLVYNDESTDGTGAILRRLGETDIRLGTVPPQPLPPGWVGKPHACHRLGEHARGDVLLFLDADVRLQRDGIARMVDLLHDADVVTAVPRQEFGSFFERLIVPLLHLTYMAWLPLWLIPRTRDPRVLAANGQLLAMKRSTWEKLGGYASVRDAIVDDMALCRRAKSLGLKVLFADGHDVASCRMYRSAKEVWEGFSKNLYLGIGAHPLRLLAITCLYAAAFVVPFAVMVVVPVQSTWWPPALAGVTANLLLRAVISWRHQHPLSAALWHPFAVLGLLAIAFNSYFWARARNIRWAGRTYREAKA